MRTTASNRTKISNNTPFLVVRLLLMQVYTIHPSISTYMLDWIIEIPQKSLICRHIRANLIEQLIIGLPFHRNSEIRCHRLNL